MIRTLVVEDDPLLGRVLGRRLSRHVAVDVVDVVPDSDTALTRLELDAVDVVVTDWDLGACSLDGIDLATVIHERWPSVPVVLASGSIDDAVRARALGAAISRCFTKPVAVDALVTTLRQLVPRPA